MAASTLAEYAKTFTDPAKIATVSIFAQGSPVLGLLGFETAPGGVYPYNVETTLPGIAFRALNASYTASSGIIVPYIEKTKILGGEADYDTVLISRFGMERRTLDIASKINAAARYFDAQFIDGDESANPKSFDGLNRRLTGDQHIHANGSTGAAGANLTENAIQRLIDAVYGGPDGLFMGLAVQRQVFQLFKGSTLFGMSEPNAWGVRNKTFAGIPMYVIDRDNLDATILAMDETEGSSSGVCGSIYALKFGPQYIGGIQSAPPDATDFGKISSSPLLRFRWEWDCGIKMEHPRCAARLSGITVVSGTA